MNRLSAFGVALLLSACAANPFTTVVQNPISRTNLYQAELVFDGSIKTFNELKSLCANRTLPPKCQTYVIQGQSLIVKARDADLAAREFIDNNPTLDAAGAVQAFTILVGQFGGTVTNLSAVK